MIRCVLAVFLATAFVAPVWMVPAFAQPQRNADKVPKKAVQKKQTKGRLPAYYGQVVNEAQRRRIYQIQGVYNPQIEALEAEIDALRAKRDAEIRDVLSPEQRDRLDSRIAEAQAARAAKKAGDKQKAIPVKKAG